MSTKIATKEKRLGAERKWCSYSLEPKRYIVTKVEDNNKCSIDIRLAELKLIRITDADFYSSAQKTQNPILAI